MKLQTKRVIGIVIVTAMATIMMGRLTGDVGAGSFLIGVGFITFIYASLGIRFKGKKDSEVIRDESMSSKEKIK